MALKLTEEKGRRYLKGLKENSPLIWVEFLGDENVKKIIGNVIAASCLRGKVSVNDLSNAIYIYTTTVKNWVPDTMETPSSFLSYFMITIRRLMARDSFVKSLLGFEVKNKQVDIDAKPEEGRSLSEKIADEAPVEQERLTEVEGKVIAFKKVIGIVSEKWPNYGELLRRRYLENEEISVLAQDFMNRGLIVVDSIENAIISMQNSWLRNARKKFNMIALSMRFPYELSGKSKRSIIKDIKEEL